MTLFQFQKNPLISLTIQSDNPVQIWEQVLKWGLAKNPELLSVPAELFKRGF